MTRGTSPALCLCAVATGRWSKSCRCHMSTESREVGPTSHALAPLCCPCLTRPSGRRAHPECPRIARLPPQPQRRAACNRWRAAGRLAPAAHTRRGRRLYAFVPQPQSKVRPLRLWPALSPAHAASRLAATARASCTDPARAWPPCPSSTRHPSVRQVSSADSRCNVRLGSRLELEQPRGGFGWDGPDQPVAHDHGTAGRGDRVACSWL